MEGQGVSGVPHKNLQLHNVVIGCKHQVPPDAYAALLLQLFIAAVNAAANQQRAHIRKFDGGGVPDRPEAGEDTCISAASRCS